MQFLLSDLKMKGICDGINVVHVT